MYYIKFPWTGINRKIYNEMHQWCEEMFGEEYVKWVGFRHGVNEFMFNNEEDKMLFLLRWSNEIPNRNW
jgi:hypothetical protein